MIPSVAAWVLSVCASAAPFQADVRWHFPEAQQRAIVCVCLPDGSEPLERPIQVTLPATMTSPGSPSSFLAWDLKTAREVPAQLLGSRLFLAPGRPLGPGEDHVLLIYRVIGTSAAATPAVRVSEDGRVEAPGYNAKLELAKGGVLRSLELKGNGPAVEMLGDGLRWWIGQKPQITPESFGKVTMETLAAGPVLTAVRIRYPKVLCDANAVVVDYRFFRDFVEFDFRYEVKTPVPVGWVKVPVSLRATGSTPGRTSSSSQRDQQLRVSGGKSRWIHDETWHEVSYAGDRPFALGVIARQATGGLYFMDSVKPDEHEWIYAEPRSWEAKSVLDRDIEVQLTLVPLAAGGPAGKTLAKGDVSVRTTLSVWQERGGPAIDSDGDGLPDLVELARGANPLAPDTDLDGIPDGTDPDPLRGPPPPRALRLPEFKAEATSRPQSLAEVKPVGGVPTLVIDGKPYGPMTYTRCAGTLPQIGEIADHRFPVHFEMVGSIGRPGKQEKVFDGLDGQLRRFLQQVPNARIVLRLYVCNPRGFGLDHPDEVMRFDDGSTQHFTKWYAESHWPAAERGYPSFASEVWRQETAQALREYVTHVRQSDYAKSVVGYFVCGGGTEEWYYWGDYDHKHCVDSSPPMLRAFRDHLRRKYDGDVVKLRAAWHDRHADFATALPPDHKLRWGGTPGVFWPDGARNHLRDYYEVHNKAMEDSVLIFARAVKQSCDRQQLVGMFHGYLQNHWFLEGGQATLHDVLDSPDIDFWAGPPQYDRRGPGEHGCIRFLMASLKKHGKLWISESDIRTLYSEINDHNPSLYGRSPDLEETLGCLKREFAHQICEGANGWWFQMGKEWYHHPPILELFSKMQTIGEASTGLERATETDIAAVVDLKSLFVGIPWPVSSPLLDAFKVQELCRLGSPIDHYELRDILAPDARRYKLYLMLNCFRLTNEERQAIDQRLRRDGAVLVWMYAPGWFNPSSQPDEAPGHCANLLGFPLRSEIAPALGLSMKLTAAGAEYFSGFDPARTFGSFERPRWEPDKKTGKIHQVTPGPMTIRQRISGDPSGNVLARFSDSQEPAIVLRRTERATDLWIGSVMAPADLLRAVARRAKCHLYCDADEIVYANRSFLAIHTSRPGKRTFQLRRESDVIEVFTGQVLARGAGRFDDTIDACRTRLYYLGPEAAWQAQTRRAESFFAEFLSQLHELRKQQAKP